METGRVGLILLAIVFTTTLALVYVGLEVKSVQLGYQVKSNEGELERLQDENQTLKVNLTALESPGYLEKVLIGHPAVVKTPADFQVIRVKSAAD